MGLMLKILSNEVHSTPISNFEFVQIEVQPYVATTYDHHYLES